MNIKIIYEDNDVLVIDKPAGLVVFREGEGLKSQEKTVIEYLVETHPELKQAGEAPRYGIVHRIDKDTSGLLLVAKSTESLIFLQKQFINREVEKKYICLVDGVIKDNFGRIETLIARASKDKRKQKVFLKNGMEPKSARDAVTDFEVLKRFENYTLLSVSIKTGRRHQIRCHFSYLRHPVAGDKLYSFKDSKIPEGLTRQFLHAGYLKIKLPSGETKEFKSELPEDLQNVINNLKN